MLELFAWIFIFVISLVVLIKASDYFTDGAEKLGIYFGIPSFIVGVTIVAFGTSLPELFSSLFSVFVDESQIVVANVIGSNITNILLVFALAAIIGKKFIVSHEIEKVDLPIFIISAFFLYLTLLDGVFSIYEGILMLLSLAVYLFYLISNSFESRLNNGSRVIFKKKNSLSRLVYLKIVFGAIFVFIGAKYTIDSTIQISTILGVPTEIIAIIAIALGTSLPELSVTVMAARKGNAEIAVGNVLGSNIFNTFMVMGIPSLFIPFFTNGDGLIVSDNILFFALPMMLVASLCFLFIARDREVHQWEGWILLILYIFFVGKIVGLM
jgi:cation:H+ antiporter